METSEQTTCVLFEWVQELLIMGNYVLYSYAIGLKDTINCSCLSGRTMLPVNGMAFILHTIML